MLQFSDFEFVASAKLLCGAQMANRRWKDSLRFLRCRKNLEKDHVKWITPNNSLSLNHPQSLKCDWRFSRKYLEPKTLQFKALLPSSYPKFGSLWYAEPQRLRRKCSFSWKHDMGNEHCYRNTARHSEFLVYLFVTQYK